MVSVAAIDHLHGRAGRAARHHAPGSQWCSSGAPTGEIRQPLRPRAMQHRRDQRRWRRPCFRCGWGWHPRGTVGAGLVVTAVGDGSPAGCADQAAAGWGKSRARRCEVSTRWGGDAVRSGAGEAHGAAAGWETVISRTLLRGAWTEQWGPWGPLPGCIKRFEADVRLLAWLVRFRRIDRHRRPFGVSHEVDTAHLPCRDPRPEPVGVRAAEPAKPSNRSIVG